MRMKQRGKFVALILVLLLLMFTFLFFDTRAGHSGSSTQELNLVVHPVVRDQILNEGYHEDAPKYSTSVEALVPSGSIVLSPQTIVSMPHLVSEQMPNSGEAPSNGPISVPFPRWDFIPSNFIPSMPPYVGERVPKGYHGKEPISNELYTKVLSPSSVLPVTPPSIHPSTPIIESSLPPSAPSKPSGTGNNHSRILSPSPHGLPGDFIPSNFIPSMPPYVGESVPIGYHAKAPISNEPHTKGLMPSPPRASPSKSLPVQPGIQHISPSLTLVASSPVISIKHKHSRLIPPSVQFLAPHGPNEKNRISPSPRVSPSSSNHRSDQPPLAAPPMGMSQHSFHGSQPQIKGPSPVQPASAPNTVSAPLSQPKPHSSKRVINDRISLSPWVAPSTSHRRSDQPPLAAPPMEMSRHSFHRNHPQSKGASPVQPARSRNTVSAPPSLPKPHSSKRVINGPAYSPSDLFYPPSRHQGPVVPLAPSPLTREHSSVSAHPPGVVPMWRKRLHPPKHQASHHRRDQPPLAAPPMEMSRHSFHGNHPQSKGASPVQPARPPNTVSAPLSPPQPHFRKRVINGPTSSPSDSFHPPSHHQGPVVPLAPAPLNRERSSVSAHPPGVVPKWRKYLHPPKYQASPSQSPSQAPFPSMGNLRSPPSLPSASPIQAAPSRSPSQPPFPLTGKVRSPSSLPSATIPSAPSQGLVHPPSISSIAPSPKKSRSPVPSPVRLLPPPPPNIDCTGLTCTEPYTNTPPGSPCGCVFPMQVGLRLGVALYAFFPLVSELAQEVAAGILMKQSQVRIMGANADTEQQEKTIVLIDLVPLGQKFDNTTAFLTFEKFWHKQVVINVALFGDYDVLYVRYPGLPPSPPSASINVTLDDGPYASSNISSRKVNPIGVDVRHRRHKLGGTFIAIIALSSAIGLVICLGALWFMLLRKGGGRHQQPAAAPRTPVVPIVKQMVGVGSALSGSGLSSASLSFGSSIATYAGSAKTFSLGEMERATNRFDPARILGEGGFGRVYSGVLEDGTKVAVKVLTRDDQQGGREFLAEVEMLSRLHHRNLVKLIGICTEEHNRCLVYELVPNGSVESHLHGVDRETSPLDWNARMKIALGSARGLAYLHEDSSPRVIHRDFKSSNILLEDDFTPKVSDFGLARAASEGGNEHISTRVMGTFGYVAPEYAMTGHLLVKSDVYSYGVVLLELLTGRKPVDMSQPQGQENLVTWARPLLTSKEGLDTIADPALVNKYPFDSMAKVAAIASMCVQPEVSHRPFMGEVVQALKLVCHDSDEREGGGSGSYSQEGLSTLGIEIKGGSTGLQDTTSFVSADCYDTGMEAERGLSGSDVFSASARLVRELSGSFRRHSSSGPLMRTSRSRQLWRGIRGLSSGSMSEHRAARKSHGVF
ncbi:uncharacterized protein LOC18443583 isoform X4 [Amborella trichopoda]|uniref:uncharacterized protein LOC18443583 isoform X4 n=1 Tax=Amborella trichopoda TaxID=13333 RepID=UPI0009BF28D8|nr:uncharacterized protein LOC18443583 isoform X4 [Amborella trichopoda]|eukprot:XP_020528859.1 uncharacterized protein LOC18443583 isoform X4 [Amborella trichopoda]